MYSAFTYYTGFKVTPGEYELMGLAPYGRPLYTQKILDHLIDIKDDGTFRLDMDYFNCPTGLTMTNHRFDDLFGGPPRRAESELTQREMDIAASIQAVTEDVLLKLGHTVQRELDADYLCMAGGVALNCVANGQLLRGGPFNDIWIQPAAGDAGGAVGSGLAVWHQYYGNKRTVNGADGMAGSYLGPSFSAEQIRTYLDSVNASYTELDDAELFPSVAAGAGQ